MTATVVHVLHTADLGPHRRREVRALLDRAFDGEFEDTDWEHALGGLHAVIVEADRVVAHAALVQRRLFYRGRALRTGYVEALAVEEERRGRGYARLVMAELERVVRAAYDLGALSAADGVDAFYRRRGWRLWQGPTSVLAPDGLTRTPDDDDSTYVLPPVDGLRLDLTGPIACDWRDGDVW
ncbi:GNAT family N-acetyltransferase [Dactylosporangium fulvum]|uniref:GNAT family N-acetyltransferase n=1 Tax=Dactylosporangium fulvum TaxID=53359 RepID=A0ABY5VY89_9ACTN|nr:GNAT family N-acetyltransferase [Dactylosporangium fulvum]UWP82134.1 GNAT family N-acetyltransferase [Dactylosporangium fulvum]